MGREQAVYKVGSKPSFAVVQFLWTGWLRDSTERKKSSPGSTEIGTGETWKAVVTKSVIRSQIPGVGI